MKRPDQETSHSAEVRLLIEMECIDVDTGQVKVTALPVILRSIALGSCIAVAVLDRPAHIAGLAHVMLPGRSRDLSAHDHTRYAEDAIDAVLDGMASLGSSVVALDVYLVGGANVLGEGDIPEKVLSSVTKYLGERGLQCKASRVGGNMRRSAFVNNLTGSVLYTEGDADPALLVEASAARPECQPKPSGGLQETDAFPARKRA